MTIDFFIQERLLGILTEKNNGNIKQLMMKYKIQINIPRAPDFPCPQRLIQIKGTRDQIDLAKKDIESLLNCPMLEIKSNCIPDPKMLPMWPPFCIYKV